MFCHTYFTLISAVTKCRSMLCVLCIVSPCIAIAIILMAEGNQPRERNLAAEAFRKNYSALHDALAQPGVAGVLATKLYSGAIITSETRDAVQMSSFTPTQQANCLLQAVESSIKIDHTRLRKFTRVLKKQPVLKPIARQLRQCYSKFLNALWAQCLNCYSSWF